MHKEIAAGLNLPSLEKGWVWLVGAGPGDPGLITALGLQALSQADVILYDALVDEHLLTLSTAEKIYAGKRAGVRSCKQDEISDTLVALAKEGKRVLRLKGGDPFVFGRGGEEAQALARAGVPFRIGEFCTVGRGLGRSGERHVQAQHQATDASGAADQERAAGRVELRRHGSAPPRPQPWRTASAVPAASLIARRTRP